MFFFNRHLGLRVEAESVISSCAYGPAHTQDERKANPRERSYNGEAFNAKVNVIYHVFHRLDNTGRIPEAIIQKQHEVLQKAFDDSQTTDPVRTRPHIAVPISYPTTAIAAAVTAPSAPLFYSALHFLSTWSTDKEGWPLTNALSLARVVLVPLQSTTIDRE